MYVQGSQYCKHFFLRHINYSFSDSLFTIPNIHIFKHCKWGIFLIFNRNESILYLCRIWLSVLIIYDVTLTEIILSDLHHFTFNYLGYICMHSITFFCHGQICTNEYLSLFTLLWFFVKLYYFRVSLILYIGQYIVGIPHIM